VFYCYAVGAVQFLKTNISQDVLGVRDLYYHFITYLLLNVSVKKF